MIKTTYYQDLTKMNTFGMKVKARCFMEYDSVADLVDIEFSELARPVLHIGGGSNLLFTDDFKGTVLHSKIDFIEILEEEQTGEMKRLASQESGDMLVSSSSSLPASHADMSAFRNESSGNSFDQTDVYVSVGAGVVFDDFCAWAAKEGLWGVENLSYIPGEVGASAVQNIGAYGVEVKDVIHKVYCYDTFEEEFVSFSVEECGYGYRDSIFKKPDIKGRYIVTHVVFALSREPKPRLEYGHLKEAVTSAYGECQCVPEAPSQLSLGPSPYPGVGKCQLRTTALYPHDNKNSQQTPEHIESHIIQFAKEVRMVLALGGGAVMREECEEMVHSGTLCIYLRASVETLVQRLTGEDSGRPLLSGADPGRSSKPSVLSGGPSVMSNEVETSALRTRILELMRQRSETYERVAHLIVDTDGKSVGEIAEEINYSDFHNRSH